MRKKLEENMKKAHMIIFKQFCPSHMENRIKEYPEYNRFINDPLTLIDTIAQ